ncbi:MAG: xanthine dehydrogenase family protein molybdopterin-binding subunit [Actinomycetia bacterium]|nr:xanthine dehydrogenase family protein molybdopterin-binding subunit [Actinomycetes bacterium]
MTEWTSASIRQRATGQARYAADLAPTDALVVDVARSPHAHARVLRIDPTDTLKVPGVVGVLTAEDFADVTLGRLISDEPVLTSTARHVGDGVAAIAAVDREALLAGMAALDIEYSPLPAATTIDEARSLQPDIHGDCPGNVASRFSCDRGDWESAVNRVVEWAEATFDTAPVPHAYLEPRATYVRVMDDHLELVTGTHFPVALQEDYGQIVREWGAEVRIVTPEIGGSFGAKWEHPTHLICLAFANRLGRDVAMITPRRDDMIAGRSRLGMRMTMALGADTEGRLIAKKTFIEADNGAYSGHGPSVTVSAAIRADNLYRYDAVSVSTELIYTNTMPSECFRGFGLPQAVFAQEQLVDELAIRLGIGPAEMRRRNTVTAGETTLHGWEIASSGLEVCLDEIETRIEFDKLARPANADSDRRYRIGYGLATCIHGISSRAYDPRFDRDEVTLTPHPDGTITVASGEVEIGCGTNDVLATIVADELGVDRSILSIVLGDGNRSPYGLGNFASRTTLFAGRAAIDACQRLRVRCGEMAIDLDLAVDVTPIAVMAAAASAGRIDELAVSGTFEPDNVVIPDPSGYGNVSAAYNFSAHGCCISVDTWTGKAIVLQYWAAHDLGHIFNPNGAEGQVIGGVTQGLGMALTEELTLDPQGRVLNPGFLDNRVATFADAVPIEAIFVDTHDPAGPRGAKTIGEPPLIPVPACVANAIHDAVGVRMHRTPMTSEQIWYQLQQHKHQP